MSLPDYIKVPIWFVAIVVAGVISWLSWMSLGIISLKSDMSAVKERLQITTVTTVATGDPVKDLAHQ